MILIQIKRFSIMSNTKKVTLILKTDMQTKLDSFNSVSAKIRFLDYNGIDRADIARILNKRYQHVRNILNMNVKNVSEKYKFKIK